MPSSSPIAGYRPHSTSKTCTILMQAWIDSSLFVQDGWLLVDHPHKALPRVCKCECGMVAVCADVFVPFEVFYIQRVAQEETTLSVYMCDVCMGLRVPTESPFRYAKFSRKCKHVCVSPLGVFELHHVMPFECE